MKRSKCLVLLVSLVLVAMVLPSCGKTIKTASSFERVLNPDYEVTYEPWREGIELEDLKGFSLVEATDTFAVFSYYGKDKNWADNSIHKVYSLLQNKVILTLSYTEPRRAVVDIQRWSDGIIRVKTNEYGETEDKPLDVVFYDLAGNELARRKNQDWTPTVMYLGDYVVLDNVAYEVDMETGVCTKVMDVPDYAMLRSSKATEIYNNRFYVGNARSLSIYDENLQWICDWQGPSYLSSYSFFVLNDGTVLIQYAYSLDENAKKYDYYTTDNDETLKFRLVTLLMNPKTGKTKELDFAYKIDRIQKNGEIEDRNSSPYGDSFENIAYLYPITDKKIDHSDSSTEIVLLSNQAKIEKSLKLIEGQMPQLPQKVGEGLYRVDLITGGCVIVNIDGEVIRTVNDVDFAEHTNETFHWTQRAVYNLAYETVYDLKQNHAEVVGDIVDSLLLKVAEKDGSYRILVLDQDGAKEIYSYDAALESEDTFTVFPYLGYRVKNEDKTYTYYNVKGETLLTTYETLVLVSSNSKEYSHAVLYCAAEAAQYYVFSK